MRIPVPLEKLLLWVGRWLVGVLFKAILVFLFGVNLTLSMDLYQAEQFHQIMFFLKNKSKCRQNLIDIIVNGTSSYTSGHKTKGNAHTT